MKYRDFAPTQFYAAGAFLPERQDWLVMPVSHNRDSDSLVESNWETALKVLKDRLGDETDEDSPAPAWEIHRFRPWGPGWFEIILVHPDHAAVVEDYERNKR